jgi:hypothetical protein
MMNYFFYKDYMFNKMIKHEASLLVSAIMISVIEFTNLYTILSVVDMYLFNLKPITTVLFTCMIPIGIALIVLNVCYYSKNVEQIYNRYKGERLSKNILGYIFYVGYYIGSIILGLWLI